MCGTNLQVVITSQLPSGQASTLTSPLALTFVDPVFDAQSSGEGFADWKVGCSV